MEHPYRWDDSIEQGIRKIVETNSPALTARAINSNHPNAPTEECSKAQDKVIALEKALESQIRKLQKINPNTLLVLMP